MVIAHNIYAMNAQRQFKINTKSKAKNNEKLSSGYKINRSADDAAGLSISEKMRNQIRNLNQGINNTEDGILLIKTAEGALQESQNILKRMHELAVQAANDINSIEDRQAIQNEIDSLYGEIDDIANKTQFNGKFPLKMIDSSTEVDYVRYDKLGNAWTLPSYLKEISFPVTFQYDTYDKDGVLHPANSSLYMKTTYVRKEDSNSDYDVILTNGGFGGLTPTIWGYESNPYTLSDDPPMPLSDLKVDEEGYVYDLDVSSSTEREYRVYRMYDQETGNHGLSNNNNKAPNVIQAKPSTEEEIKYSQQLRNNNSNILWIQSGANAGEGLFISTVDATTTGIGLTNVNVLSHQSASNSMGMIDNALKKVSEYRSQFGAQQNRLEYTIEHELNYSENLQNAESNLRDTDMAKEMLEYSKNSILEQAAQSMISQANQQNQGMLQLLQ